MGKLGPDYVAQLVEAVNEELLAKHTAASSVRRLSANGSVASAAAAAASAAAPLPLHRLPPSHLSQQIAFGPPLPVALCVAVDCRKSQSAGVKTLRQALADEHKRLRERLAVRALASIRVSCVRL